MLQGSLVYDNLGFKTTWTGGLKLDCANPGQLKWNGRAA